MLSLVDVYQFIDQFEESGKHIASVAAQTGTGKSTMFPEGFFRKNLDIFIIQPTITASTGLAKYMKTRIPEDSIGTAVEGNVNYTNKFLYFHHERNTPMVYCTAGHLRNILLKFGESGKPKKFVDYIFLDEAHTGSVDFDLIMYMYDYLLKIPNAKLPKLILITATPGVYPFKESEVFPASYPGRESYPVQVKYHNKDYTNLKGKDYKELFEDVIDVVIRTHEDNPVDDNEVDGWVVFCPGKAEIMDVVENLRKRTHNTIIIPLYSGMTDENSLQYDLIPPDGFRKIVVSSNIAEASLTIEGLSYVFDTLIEKITVQSRTGGTMLQATNIPKSSAKQRKGRTGRTRPGTCYRMCTEKFFDSLPENRLREIERISPDGMILDLLSRNLKVEEIVSDNAIDKKTLEKAKNRLATIGLLTDDALNVTLAGEWAKNNPLSPRASQFFWLWSIYSSFNPFIGSVITSVLETHGGGYFYIGEEDPPIETVLKKKFLPVVNDTKNSESKSSLYFNISLIMYIISEFRSIEIPPKELKGYCAQNNLNNAKVKDCLKLIRQLSSKGSKDVITIGNFDIDYELSKAEDHLYQSFSDLSYRPGSKTHSIKYEMDSLINKNDAIPNNSIILPLGSFETPNKIYVSLYHYVDHKPEFKVSMVRNKM